MPQENGISHESNSCIIILSFFVRFKKKILEGLSELEGGRAFRHLLLLLLFKVLLNCAVCPDMHFFESKL